MKGACVCGEATTSQKLGADGAGDGLVPAQLHLVGEEVESVRALGAEVTVHSHPGTAGVAGEFL